MDIVSQVEDLLSLGLRSAQKMYMTEWRGRLILAVIEASGVSLYAIEPKTLMVGLTGQDLKSRFLFTLSGICGCLASIVIY